MTEKIMQVEILKDVSITGNEKPWARHKVGNELLALAYQMLGNIKKVKRLNDCATFLQFLRGEGNKQTLKTANFCRIRLCPICQWRRSLKVFGEVMKIVENLEKKKHYAYIMATFTVKNVQGEELSATIDSMMKAWNRFTGYKKLLNVVKGYYRAMEITHDVDQIITRDMWFGNKKRHIKPRKDYYMRLGLNIGDPNPSYNTYHPHFHCIFAVNINYFHGKSYLTHKDWQILWAKAAKLDYTPQVNVKRVKDTHTKSMAHAIAETAKYTVEKDAYIIPDDWDLTTETVAILDKALNNRRFVAFGGVFKDMKDELGLDDPEDGDLIHVDGEPPPEDNPDDVLYTYYWRSGYSAYVLGEPFDS